MRINDLTGRRFDRLVVEGIAFRKNNRIYWRCKCDCGNFVNVLAYNLIKKQTHSCGCYNKDKTKERMTKHGLSRHPLFTIWKAIKRRCCDTKCLSYKNYGGRGIIVCDEWRNSYINFYNWAISTGYKNEKLKSGKNKWTIDRMNNDGNYEPSNCRWTTDLVQSQNTRIVRKFNVFGEVLTIEEMCKKYNINKYCLRTRIARNWDIEKAVLYPVKKLKGE